MYTLNCRQNASYAKNPYSKLLESPELIMMKCVNCGEIHMIGTTTNGEATALTFWDSDAGPII